MFDTKNISPQQLAFYTAFLLSIPDGIAFILFKASWLSLFVYLVILVGSYFIIEYILEHYIDRKIKLIYKFIYQTKATQREEMYYKYILPRKSIDEVTEDVEKWASQRREEIETLKSNEAFRKEFLQNLSHEIKTPIFAIQGYVDTLLEGALDNPDVNKKFLENTSRNVDRLVNLVCELDVISSLESGEQPLNKTNFSIQEVIREAFDALSIKSSKQNIRCMIKKGCEQPVYVHADKEKIKQVVMNLLTNAIKYGKENGQVIASIYKTDGQRVLVEVSDDGIGIAEEHLPRIFERFYRTDRGRSRNIGGTGLGLAICKHIIEAHGQAIHVRSKIDIGTTVGFTLEQKKES